MKEEVERLVSELEEPVITKLAHTDFYQGHLNGKEVVLVESGIGKVNASIITTLLIHHFKVTAVINTGVAGGLSESLNVCDIVISDKVSHHDVDATYFGYDYGQVPGMPLDYDGDKLLIEKTHALIQNDSQFSSHIGRIVSGDSFIDAKESRQLITDRVSDALAVDMESAPIAQVCHQFGIPFIIIRSISDTSNDKTSMKYEEFLEVACVNSSNVVKLLMNVM